MNAIPDKMMGVVLPGNSTVEFREYDVPEPGHGQVLLKVKASSICGSDIRAKAGSDSSGEHLGHKSATILNRHYKRLPKRVKPTQ